jgi:hypothetical protein
LNANIIINKQKTLTTFISKLGFFRVAGTGLRNT